MRHIPGKPYRVAVVVDLSIKANRDKRSGVLRYFASWPDVQLFLLGHSRSIVRQLSDNRDVDGIIDIGAGEFHDFRQPFVTFDEFRQTSDLRVNIDNEAIARSAATFLTDKGNANFAYVETDLPLERIHSEERAEGFQRALRPHGHEAQVFSFGTVTATTAVDELAALAKWLKELPKPCGVFAYADCRAQVVIDACNLARLDIPGQINLIGVDNDIDICEYSRPTLTSIWPDFEQAGFLGARLLHQRLLGRLRSKAPPLRYGVKCIVERASTQDLRGGGRLVSLANEYLRTHYREAIKSTDIARHLNVSRRLLDLRFREITSTTVQKEIERLRMLEVERLLRTTELSALEISSLCGYRTVMAFRKAFERTFRTTSTKALRRSLRSR